MIVPNLIDADYNGMGDTLDVYINYSATVVGYKYFS